MSLPVILRHVARAEFDAAADWYERRRKGRGATFTAAVRQALSAIAARPEAYAEVHSDIREALVHGFPYAVYYRPEARQITILAIIHTSRDPSEWQRRV